jgi:hypothetical protein
MLDPAGFAQILLFYTFLAADKKESAYTARQAYTHFTFLDTGLSESRFNVLSLFKSQD